MPDWLLDHSFLGMPFHFWTVEFAIFGAMIGSFLNVCIHRMPLGESVFSPPSRCPHCKWRIPFLLNVPILTWLWLRGKCRNCKAPISPRYLVVELITCIAFAGAWLWFGRDSIAVAAVMCVLLSLFIASSGIDLEHMIIPDEFTLGGAAVGFVLSAMVPAIHRTDVIVQSLRSSGLGIIVGAAVVYAVLRLGKLLFGRHNVPVPPGSRVVFHETGVVLPDRQIPFEEIFYRASDTIRVPAQRVELPDRCYRDIEVSLSPKRLRLGDEELEPEEVAHMEITCDRIVLPREAMGLGDVKFMGMIGAFLGWQATLFTLTVSAFLGAAIGIGLIAVGRREWSARIPYGPYIAAAAILWMFGGSTWFFDHFSRWR